MALRIEFSEKNMMKQTIDFELTEIRKIDIPVEMKRSKELKQKQRVVFDNFKTFVSGKSKTVDVNEEGDIVWVSVFETPERLGRIMAERCIEIIAQAIMRKSAKMIVGKLPRNGDDEVMEYMDELVRVMEFGFRFGRRKMVEGVTILKRYCDMENSKFRVLVEDEWQDDLMYLLERSFFEEITKEMSVYSEDVREITRERKVVKENGFVMESEIKDITPDQLSPRQVKLDSNQKKQVKKFLDRETNDASRRRTRKIKECLKRMKDGSLMSSDFSIDDTWNVKLNFMTTPNVNETVELGFSRMTDKTFIKKCQESCESYIMLNGLENPFESDCGVNEIISLMKALAMDVEEKGGRREINAANGFKCLFECYYFRDELKVEKVSDVHMRTINNRVTEASENSAGFFTLFGKLQKLSKANCTTTDEMLDVLGRIKGICGEIIGIMCFGQVEDDTISGRSRIEPLVNSPDMIKRAGDVDLLTICDLSEIVRAIIKVQGYKDDFYILSEGNNQVYAIEIGCKTRFLDKCKSDMEKLGKIFNENCSKVSICFRSMTVARRVLSELITKEAIKTPNREFSDKICEVGLIAENALRDIATHGNDKSYLDKANRFLGDSFKGKLDYRNCKTLSRGERNDLIKLNVEETMESIGFKCGVQKEHVLESFISEKSVDESNSHIDTVMNIEKILENVTKEYDEKCSKEDEKVNNELHDASEEIVGRSLIKLNLETGKVKNRYTLNKFSGYESYQMFKSCIEEVEKGKDLDNCKEKSIKRLGCIDCDSLKVKTTVFDETNTELSSNILLLLDNVNVRAKENKRMLTSCISQMIRLNLVMNGDHEKVTDVVFKSLVTNGFKYRMMDSYRRIDLVSSALLRCCNKSREIIVLPRRALGYSFGEEFRISGLVNWIIVEDRDIETNKRHSCFKTDFGMTEIMKDFFVVINEVANDSKESCFESYKELIDLLGNESRKLFKPLTSDETFKGSLTISSERLSLIMKRLDEIKRRSEEQRDVMSISKMVMSSVLQIAFKMKESIITHFSWEEFIEEFFLKRKMEKEMINKESSNFLKKMLNLCLIVPRSSEAVRKILLSEGHDSDADMMAELTYPESSEKYQLEEKIGSGVDKALLKLFGRERFDENNINTESLTKAKMGTKPEYKIFTDDCVDQSFEADTMMDDEWEHSVKKAMGLESTDIGREITSDLFLIRENLGNSNEYRKLYFERALARTIVHLSSDKRRRGYQIAQVRGYQNYIVLISGGKHNSVYEFCIIDSESNCSDLIRINEQKLSFMLSNVSMVMNVLVNQIDCKDVTVEKFFEKDSTRRAVNYISILRRMNLIEFMSCLIGTSWLSCMFYMFNATRLDSLSLPSKANSVKRDIEQICDLKSRIVKEIIDLINSCIDKTPSIESYKKIKENCASDKLLMKRICIIIACDTVVMIHDSKRDLKEYTFDSFCNVFMRYTLKVMKENSNDTNEQMQKTRFLIMHRLSKFGNYLGYGNKLYTASRKGSVCFNRLQSLMSLLYCSFDKSKNYLMSQTDMTMSMDTRKCNNEMYLNQFFCKMLIDHKNSMRTITWKVVEKVAEWDDKIKSVLCEGKEKCYCGLNDKESMEKKVVINCLLCSDVYNCRVEDEVMFCLVNQNKFATSSPKMTYMLTSTFIHNNRQKLLEVIKGSKSLEKHDLISMSKSTGMVDHIVKELNISDAKKSAAERIVTGLVSKRISKMRAGEEVRFGLASKVKEFLREKLKSEERVEVKKCLEERLSYGENTDANKEMKERMNDWTRPFKGCVKMIELQKKTKRDLKIGYAVRCFMRDKVIDKSLELKKTKALRIFQGFTKGVLIEQKIESRMKILEENYVNSLLVLNNDIQSVKSRSDTIFRFLTGEYIDLDIGNEFLFPEEIELYEFREKNILSLINESRRTMNITRGDRRFDGVAVREEMILSDVKREIEEACMRAYFHETGIFEYLKNKSLTVSRDRVMFDNMNLNIDIEGNDNYVKRDGWKKNSLYMYGMSLAEELSLWLSNKGCLNVKKVPESISTKGFDKMHMQIEFGEKFGYVIRESKAVYLSIPLDLRYDDVDQWLMTSAKSEVKIIIDLTNHSAGTICDQLGRLWKEMNVETVMIDCVDCKSRIFKELENAEGQSIIEDKETICENVKEICRIYSNGMRTQLEQKDGEEYINGIRSGMVCSLDIFSNLKTLKYGSELMRKIRIHKIKVEEEDESNIYFTKRDEGEDEVVSCSKEIRVLIHEYRDLLSDVMKFCEESKSIGRMLVSFGIEILCRSLSSSGIEQSTSFLCECDIGATMGLRDRTIAECIQLFMIYFKNSHSDFKRVIFGSLIRKDEINKLYSIAEMESPQLTLENMLRSTVRKMGELKKDILRRTRIKSGVKDKVAFQISKRIIQRGENIYAWDELIRILRDYDKVNKRFFRHQTCLAPKNQLGGPRDLVVQTLDSAIMQSCVEVVGKDIYSVFENNSLSNKSCKKEFAKDLENIQREKRSGFTAIFCSKDGESWGPKMKGGHLINVLGLIFRTLGFGEVARTLEVCASVWDNRETEIGSEIIEDFFVRMMRFDLDGFSLTDIVKKVFKRDEERTQQYILERCLRGQKYVKMFNHMGQGLLQCTSTGMQVISADYIRKEFMWVEKGRVEFKKICGSDDSMEIIRIKDEDDSKKVIENKLLKMCEKVRTITSSLNINDSSKSSISLHIGEYHSEFTALGQTVPSKCKFMSGMLTTSDTSDIFKIIESTYSMVRQGLENGCDLFDTFSMMCYRFISVFGPGTRQRQRSVMEMIQGPSCVGGIPPFEIVNWSTLDKSDYSDDCKFDLCLEKFEKGKPLDTSEKIVVLLKFLEERGDGVKGKMFSFRNIHGCEKKIDDILDDIRVNMDAKVRELYSVILKFCRVTNMEIDKLRMVSILRSLKRDGAFERKTTKEVREEIFRKINGNNFQLEKMPKAIQQEILAIRSRKRTGDNTMRGNGVRTLYVNWLELKEALLEAYQKYEELITDMMRIKQLPSIRKGDIEHINRFRQMRRTQVLERGVKLVGLRGKISLFDIRKRFINNETILVVAWQNNKSLVRECGVRDFDENTVREDGIRIKLRNPELFHQCVKAIDDVMNGTESQVENVEELLRKLNRKPKLLSVFVDLQSDKYQNAPQMFYESSCLKGCKLVTASQKDEFCLNTPRGLCKEIIGFTCAFTGSTANAIDLLDVALNKTLSTDETESFGISGTILNNLYFSKAVGDARLFRDIEEIIRRRTDVKFEFNVEKATQMFEFIKENNSIILRGGSRMMLVDSGKGLFICGPMCSQIDIENCFKLFMKEIFSITDVMTMKRLVSNRGYTDMNMRLDSEQLYISIDSSGSVSFGPGGIPYVEIRSETKKYMEGKDVNIVKESKTVRKRNGFEVRTTETIVVSSEELNRMIDEDPKWYKQNSIVANEVKRVKRVAGSKMFGDKVIELCTDAFREKEITIKPRKSYSKLFLSLIRVAYKAKEGDDYFRNPEKIEEVKLSINEFFEREMGRRSTGPVRLDLEATESESYVLFKRLNRPIEAPDERIVLMSCLRSCLLSMRDDSNYIDVLKRVSKEKIFRNVPSLKDLNSFNIEVMCGMISESFCLVGEISKSLEITSRGMSGVASALDKYRTYHLMCWPLKRNKMRSMLNRKMITLQNEKMMIKNAQYLKEGTNNLCRLLAKLSKTESEFLLKDCPEAKLMSVTRVKLDGKVSKTAKGAITEISKVMDKYVNEIGEIYKAYKNVVAIISTEKVNDRFYRGEKMCRDLAGFRVLKELVKVYRDCELRGDSANFKIGWYFEVKGLKTEGQIELWFRSFCGSDNLIFSNESVMKKTGEVSGMMIDYIKALKLKDNNAERVEEEKKDDKRFLPKWDFWSLSEVESVEEEEEEQIDSTDEGSTESEDTIENDEGSDDEYENLEEIEFDEQLLEQDFITDYGNDE